MSEKTTMEESFFQSCTQTYTVAHTTENNEKTKRFQERLDLGCLNGSRTSKGLNRPNSRTQYDIVSDKDQQLLLL